VTRILTEADVAAVLSLDDCIAAVEQAFRAYGEGRVPPPQRLGIHAEHGTFHIKAAMADVFAAKLNANFPGNRTRHGLPTIQGVILVVDPDRGTPLGILDSALITTLRTAAATAVAAKYLARMDARTATVIGCGVQGRAQLEALKRVRTIERVFAFDSDPAAAAAIAGAELGTSLEEAVAQSDVVLTCTTSRVPILDERHLHPGLFIAGVGADNPEKHELAPALLAGSRIVPDIAEQAAKMGDLHHAIAAGVLTRDDIHGELADVLCGRVPARTSEEEIFVFDSTGTALQDVAAAAVALRRAAERGIGLEIALTS
jgi:ornithine cyclodeaminase/alanine dehydrogenase-like protein (mu-crystallin family)